MLIAIAAILSSLCLTRADGFFTFVTRPDIQAPRWNISYVDKDKLQQGLYWFTAPYHKLEQHEYKPWTGPYIYDTSGGLIWSGTDVVDHINTYDFRATVLDGKPVLSYIWAKSNSVGNGYILDNSYTVRAVVDMDAAFSGRNKKFDMHEFHVIDDGERALMMYDSPPAPTEVHEPGYNGTCDINWQGFREVDVQTGEIYFDWQARDHIIVSESTYIPDRVEDDRSNEWELKCTGSWGELDIDPVSRARGSNFWTDFTHCNSIERLDDGDYLLSCRHTDTVYKISSKDHSIVWRLGGLYNDFVVNSPEAEFSRQHDARFHTRNQTHLMLSIFDNATGKGKFEKTSSDTSWGKLLALRTDTIPMTVNLVARFEKPKLQQNWDHVDARGSLSYLPNGNAFIAWAVKSMISEHSPDGKMLMTAIMDVDGLKTYRAYQLPWVGRPAQPPDVVAVADSDSTTTVHVSWNGATDVATWKLLRTNDVGGFSEPLASQSRDGFETRIQLDELAQNVVAVALDASGNELGRSNVTNVQISPELQPPALDASEGELIANQTQPSVGPSSPFSPSNVRGRPSAHFLWTLSVSMLLIGLCYICLRLGIDWWRRRRSGVRIKLTSSKIFS